ncbi:MAG: hypothetical protein OXI81_02320 [Paracoccaceae bacterium]|nr:hypothetical protein [Paracoccaceae bacterium]
MAAIWRVIVNSSGPPDLVSSTRSTARSMSTRAHSSPNTPARRMPVSSPKRKASRATALRIAVSKPLCNNGSTSAGAAMRHQF